MAVSSSSRMISKVGKKLCYPGVPADWLGSTVEMIERSQNYLPKNRILNPNYPNSSYLRIFEDKDKSFLYYLDSDGKQVKLGHDFPKSCLYYLSNSNSYYLKKNMEVEVKLEDYEDDEKYCFYRRRCSYKKHKTMDIIFPMHDVDDRFNRFNLYSKEQGTSFDVVSMLNNTSTCGGYLTRNNGDEVDIETSLRGKNVLVLCSPVPCFWSHFWSNCFRGLAAHYAASRGRGGYSEYELVIVPNLLPNWAEADAEDAFRHFLSGFPSSCLAIPFHDTLGRNSVLSNLGFTTFPVGLFVDNNHNVVYHKPLSGPGANGFQLYPFIRLLYPGVTSPWDVSLTHRRLDCFIDSEFVYKIKCNSTSTNLDDIDIWGDKVSVSELKEKLVGLYLCFDGNFLRTLDLISRECQARNQEFQIVMLYIPYRESVDPPLFIKAISHVLCNLNILSTNSNWWVSPFNDSLSRKIWELYDYFEEDKLIILEPQTKNAEPYGDFVFKKYGIDGYPFTREVVVNKELEAIRATTLESWLVYGSRDYVLRMNFIDDIGSVDKVPIAELHGKIILLYFGRSGYSSSTYDDFLEWYYWNKTTKLSDFDVVFVSMDEQFNNSIPTPWLVYPYDPHYAAFVEEKILKGRYDRLVAFDKDGQIITLNALDLLNSYGPKGFPSFEWYSGLRNEVIDYLYEVKEKEMYLIELLD